METAASRRGRFGRRIESLKQGVLATLAAIVPERCVCCEGAIERPVDRPLGEPVVWCGACASSAVPLGGPVCLDCQGGESRRQCGRRAHRRVLAAVQFGRETGALVRATKYEAYPERMSAWRDAWVERIGKASDVDLLVPVPAHPVRVRERGYDVTDVWARHLAALEGVPVARALARVRQTPPQAGADRAQRLANVRGAFAAGPEAASVAGRRVALVDDVVTTGSTVRTAAQVLDELGAAEIEIWALAFDPLD